MKMRSVLQGDSLLLKICHFGYENIGNDAKWGRGSRNVYILHYVLEGSGFFNDFSVKNGQGFLIRPMQSVEYHFDEIDPWKYFWVVFEGEYADQICQKYIKTDTHGIFTYGFCQNLIFQIGKIFSEKFPLGEAEAMSLFFYLLSMHKVSLPRSDNHYVTEAQNYIHLNFHRPLTVKEIAASQNIADRYLYNLFIKYQGVSPKQYLNKVKLQNALELLRKSDCTITEVAISVGFDDVLQFSRFFARQMGISPSAYRKKWRE